MTMPISLLSKLRDYLYPRQSPPTMYEVSGPTLTTLPREILHMVLDYLSPSDTASLVLCNRLLLHVLGKNHLTTLSGRDREQERERFLITLTRDLPKQYYCHYCSHLHPRAALGLPGIVLPENYLFLCIKDERSMYLHHGVQMTTYFTYYRPTFSHLQLAMQRYHLGPNYGISLESFTYSEAQRCGRDAFNPNLTTLFSVEARICPRPLGLYLRIQQWILFYSVECDDSIHICHHLRYHSYDELFQLRLKCNNAGSPKKIFTCCKCNTDFQIEIMEVVNEGPAIVITKWIDLGAGLTPTDPKWKVHCYGYSESSDLDPLESSGDIRLRFEN